VRRVQKGKQGGVSGFLIFAMVSLGLAFAAGFVYGIAAETPAMHQATARGTVQTGPAAYKPAVEPEQDIHGPSDLRPAPPQPGHTARQNESPPNPESVNPGAPSETFPNSEDEFRKKLEQLLADEPTEPAGADDQAADLPPDDNNGDNSADAGPVEPAVNETEPLGEPEPAQEAEPEPPDNDVALEENNDEEPEDVQPEVDPEQDLFRPTEITTGDAPDSEVVRKADDYLSDAKDLLARWMMGRKKRDIVAAKKALLKAKALYKRAEQSYPNNEYIQQRLHLTNELLYGAMKSSPF